MNNPNELFREARAAAGTGRMDPITADVAALYKSARDGDLSARSALHRRLGVKPWQASPLNAKGEPPVHLAKRRVDVAWDRAVLLRQQLEAAIA